MSAEQFRKQEAQKGAEKLWQRKIVNMAKLCGWTVTHHPYSIGANPGYPDLTLFRPGFDPLWIEVKGPKGRPKPAQVEMLEIINQTRGATAIVAYPEDLSAVDELLAGREVEFFYDHRDPVLRVRLPEEL
jgi:hypothetical protein